MIPTKDMIVLIKEKIVRLRVMAGRYDYVFYIHKPTFYSGLVGGWGDRAESLQKMYRQTESSDLKLVIVMFQI